MQLSLSSLEVTKAKAAIAVIWNLPHVAKTKDARAKEARLDLLFWDDLDSAAEAMNVAFHCDRYLSSLSNEGVWRVNADQLSQVADCELEAAVMALRLMGAYRASGLWTTHDGEISNPLRIIPASAFTHLYPAGN